ncbi:lipoma-preferred partner homolog [Lethenteron reissneri]|uniref:lipoma-preferred partner homolog n=1 Tax=Lethenteron reissneri TaxID=7753 RepID=UPI002AB6A137|nr:lipoma-preferred partner homolog [Lethenteron reissneri]
MSGSGPPQLRTPELDIDLGSDSELTGPPCRGLLEAEEPPFHASSLRLAITDPEGEPERSPWRGGVGVLGVPCGPRGTVVSTVTRLRVETITPGPRTAAKEAKVKHFFVFRAREGEGEAAAADEPLGVCVSCGLPVSGEGCVAEQRLHHVHCFTCAACARRLQGLPFYSTPGVGHLCEACYLETLEHCSVCGEAIVNRILHATGRAFHPACFACSECGTSLDGVPFTVCSANRVHCLEDFHRKFAPRCSVCGEAIVPAPGEKETLRVVALDRSFHVACYKCEDCGLVLSPSEGKERGCFPLDGHILCFQCSDSRLQARPGLAGPQPLSS